MIFHYFLSFTDSVKMAFVNWVPSFGMPGFWSENVPPIIDKIMSFNDYVPIVECIQTVVFCLSATLVWKIAKVVLGIVNINLGA